MRKKRKVKVYTVTPHPYPCEITIIVGETLRDAGVKMNKLSPHEPVDLARVGEASAMCCDRRDKKGDQVVYLLFTYKATPNKVAHETVHAVNFIYTHKGVKWDLDNDEPHAYFLGMIVGTIHHFLDNARKTN